MVTSWSPRACLRTLDENEVEGYRMHSKGEWLKEERLEGISCLPPPCNSQIMFTDICPIFTTYLHFIYEKTEVLKFSDCCKTAQWWIRDSDLSLPITGTASLLLSSNISQASPLLSVPQPHTFFSSKVYFPQN